jgi:GTP pyrophosphokinase
MKARTKKKRIRFGMGRVRRCFPSELLLSLIQDGRLSGYGRRIVQKAYELAQEAHAKQPLRGDQRPFVFHPFETALIIMLELGIWLPCVIALAILHDTIEDCPRLRGFILRSLSWGYGARLLAISREGNKRVYHAILLASDWVVILVKLADRLHNLRNILHMSEAHRIKQVVETYEYFFKLIDRLEQIIPQRYAYAPRWIRTEIRYAIRRIKKSLSEEGKKAIHA